MTPVEISARIAAFLKESWPHEGRELTESTDLLDGWFVDSLGIIMTVVYLEKEFGIDVKPEDVNGVNFQSLGTLVQYVIARGGKA